MNFLWRMFGRDIPSYELEFFAKDGNKRVGRVTASTITGEDGSIVGWASQIEYYVKGIGLWKIQTHKGEDYEVFDKQEKDPNAE